MIVELIAQAIKNYSAIPQLRIAFAAFAGFFVKTI
jgi:hypothetical protein